MLALFGIGLQELVVLTGCCGLPFCVLLAVGIVFLYFRRNRR